MPRDIHLASPRPLSLRDLVAAGAGVDDSLAVRALFHGTVLQLVNEGDVAILTIESSRKLADPADAHRIAPGLVPPKGELWWTEATAPWGVDGVTGVAVAEALSRKLGGAMIVEDGS
jgi:hypothetical protein